MALSTASKESSWLLRLCRDVGMRSMMDFTSRGRILCDNKAAISFAEEEKVAARSKHIDVSYHKVREDVMEGRLVVEPVPTNEMAADGLTKPLCREIFNTFLRLTGMVSKGEC